MGLENITKKIPLNNDWQFTKNYSDELLDRDCNLELETVRIPHTVVETPFNYFDESVYQMLSGYRKVFSAKKEWKDRRVSLNFAGAGHRASVYLNGKLIGENNCGYTAFSYDITDYLDYEKDNILVVKLDSRESLNIPPFGYVIDYMTYGGIYREVYLEVTDKLFIEDVYLKPEIVGDIEFLTEALKQQEKFKASKAKARLGFETVIKNTSKTNDVSFLHSTILRYEIFDGEMLLNKKDKSLLETLDGAFLMDAKNEGASLKESLELDNINVWDVTNPKLYKVRVSLLDKDYVRDFKEYKIGFKKAEFRDTGFYLNGRKLRIRGLNRHQSYPYVGYAMPDSMQRLDAKILRKELGVNTVRTSHYPQSKAFIEQCDELGLLVFTEIPGWQHIGDEDWKAQAVENVRNMVLQYRNYTSIILWGVRINESVDDDELYTKTNKLARELDSTRATAGVRYLKKSSFLEDVYTYNDFLHDGTNDGVDAKKKVTSDMSKAYMISEFNGHMFPTKSYDCEEHRLDHALRHAKVLNDFYKNEDIAGAIGWCMFDYNTHKDFGSGDRICYHGVLDMFRNPKMAAYVYASVQGVNPVLEISSSFDIGEHPAGMRGNTYIFTNCDSVKMYKNDIFIKEYTHKDSEYKNLKNGPILVDDYIGDAFITGENLSKKQSDSLKKCFNYVARFGMNHMPKEIYLEGIKLITIYHLNYAKLYELYQKYVGNWGGESTKFRFDGYKNGELVISRTKSTATKLHLELDVSSTELVDDETYDVAEIRVIVKDENGNQAVFFNDNLPITIKGEGLEIIGPESVKILGGMGGTYLKTTGIKGKTEVTINMPYGWDKDSKTVEFSIS